MTITCFCAYQKPGVIVISLISPGFTSELQAVGCQKNCVPNVRKPHDLRQGKPLGCLFVLGPFPGCVPSSLSAFGVPLRIQRPDLGRWGDVVEKRRLSFYLSVQWSAWSDCWVGGLVAFLSWWAFLVIFPLNLPPFTQCFSSVGKSWSGALGCCKLVGVGGGWARGWPDCWVGVHVHHTIWSCAYLHHCMGWP